MGKITFFNTVAKIISGKTLVVATGGQQGSGSAIYVSDNYSSNWFDLNNWTDELNGAATQLPLSSSNVTYTGTNTIINIDDPLWVNPNSITVTSNSVLGVSSANATAFTSQISGSGTVNFLGNVDVSVGNTTQAPLNLTKGVTFTVGASALWSDLTYWTNSSGSAAGLLPDASTNVVLSGGGNFVIDLDNSFVYPASITLIDPDPENETTRPIVTFMSTQGAVYNSLTHPISTNSAFSYTAAVVGNAVYII